MNREQDVDRLIRSWLDDGPEAMPERYLWSALERIETTRQRGAFLAPLEELFMRYQPIAALLGITAIIVAGIAAFVALSGEPRIGDDDATPSEAASGYVTSEFAVPIQFVAPEGWVTYETPSGVVTGAPIADGTVGERVVIFRTSRAQVYDQDAGAWVAWPDDLAVWLSDHPLTELPGLASIEVSVTGESERIVGGSAASEIDATTTYVPPAELGDGSADFIVVGAEGEGTDVVVRPGEMTWRFAVIADREVAVAYGATADEFSEERYEALIESLTFLNEPGA